jgi:hypothetical protein
MSSYPRKWAWAIRGTALIIGIGLLSVAGASSAADADGPLLPDADYPKMVKYAVKGIQDALKGTPDDTKATKAHTAAVMIAAYAQQNLSGADGQQRATQRDAALKLAETIKAKKYAEAIKEAGTIPSLAADPKAKKEKVKLLGEHVAFRNLMNQFNHPPDGGWGIHREFYAFQLGMKGAIPANDLREPLLLKAYQVGVTAELVQTKVPKSKEKEWNTYASDLRKGAVELADAVKGKDGRSGLDAIAKVTTSCTNCHKTFGGGPK